MSDINIRTMWCDKCNGPQDHEVTFKGTKQKKDGVHVKFLSDCLRCKDRHAMKVISTYSINFNVIPIVSYNALIQKEIYAKR